jgi:hypothetical protein
MEKWLLVSNCNTFGLANSMTLLSNYFHLDFVDVWQFRQNLEKYKNDIPRYNRVVINPEAEHSDFDFSTVENVNRIPTLDFDAYHPDICYLNARNQRLHGPTGAYHSMLVLAAFEQGLTVEQTRALFRRDIFERSGFFSRWPSARERLIKTFALYGLDVAGPFRTWSRGDAFMHALGHPKARPIHDIARTFLETCGIETDRADVIPHDTLVEGACMPVYPEIGEVYGVRGSYTFKVQGEYRLLSLNAFIAASFALYSQYSPGEIRTDTGFNERLSRVRNTVLEAGKW